MTTPAPPVATPTTGGTATQVPLPPPVGKTGAGFLGFLIVLAVAVALGGLVLAMRSSLKRLGQRQADGSFEGLERPARSGDKQPKVGR